MQNDLPGPRAELLELTVRTGRRMRTVFNARASALGLTYPRARLLAVLASHPSPTQKELASRLQLESATLVRLLDAMERMDLVERVPVDGDRRAKEVRLTQAGRRAARAVAAITRDMRAALLADIADADVSAALAVTRRMAAAIDAMAASAGDPFDEE